MFKEIEKKVFYLAAKNPGKNLLVFGGIHGDEPCGIYAINRFMNELENGTWTLKNGSITFAYGNLDAIKAQTRYVDYNMNRMFGLPAVGRDSIEYDRVRFLETLFIGKDAFLDIHSALSKAPDFLLAEKISLKTAKQIGASYLVSGWENFSDVGGDTECFANSLGVAGMTYEAGQHDDPIALENAYQVLLRFLSIHGLIEYEFKIEPVSQLFLSEVILKKSETDKWLIDIENMKFIKKGTPILELDTVVYEALYDCNLVFPTPVTKTKVGEELVFLAQA